MLKLVCEVCGKTFDASHRRSHPLCYQCAERLRSRGLGPIQSKRTENKVNRKENKLASKQCELTLEQFAIQLPEWYKKYTQSKFFGEYVSLENRLSQKAQSDGHLDIQDLAAIAEWGGNQHGLRQRLYKHNSEYDIREATSRAIQQIDDPVKALQSMLEGISQWGLSYSSKTLRFICPERYAALDQKLRANIQKTLLPPIYDGNAKSMIKGYLKFLNICREIQCLVAEPGSRSGIWLVADIEMALFQFVWDGGKLIS